jgi:hypothetical protein
MEKMQEDYNWNLKEKLKKAEDELKAKKIKEKVKEKIKLEKKIQKKKEKK